MERMFKFFDRSLHFLASDIGMIIMIILGIVFGLLASPALVGLFGILVLVTLLLIDFSYRMAGNICMAILLLICFFILPMGAVAYTRTLF